MAALINLGYRAAVALSIALPAAAFAEGVWREETFQDFADGSFSDGGANTYVSAAGRIQAINRWDANGDGYIDLVFNNTHSIAEGLNMSIYWGNGNDFEIRRHSWIPANGSQWATPADLNDDDKVDLVVANYSNGSTTDMDSYVYYCGGGGREAKGKAQVDADADAKGDWSFPPFKRRVALPTKSAQKAAVGDLNNDGQPDILFAQSGGHWEYRHSDKDIDSAARIYLGSDKGYSPGNFADLPAVGAWDAAIADLNGDDWPEAILANRGLAPRWDVDSYIYWGGPKGFDRERRTGLPTSQVSAVKVADLDGDGLQDLVFANEKGEKSVAYLNRDGKFSPEHSLEFETTSARDCVVADFNKDGRLDVFFTQGSREGNPFTDSLLYLNSDSGFSNDRRQLVPTIGAWGAAAGDLNDDGLPDLVVCNYREHYSYEVPSFIYWNSPAGFDPSLRTPLYEHGAVGCSIADFDGDGHNDILINSTVSRDRAGFDNNYVYWGNPRGEYSVDQRIELPGREVYEHAMADINDDGAVDLLFANSGETGRKMNEVWIYWNEENEFSPWRMTGLTSHFPVGVEVGDLDRDGYLDVIVTGYAEPKKGGTGSLIYWGGKDGFSTARRTGLDAGGGGCSIADLDGDGHLDLVFGAAVTPPNAPPVASIFWGSGGRDYGNDRRTWLQGSEQTDQAAVADLDRDGHLDLAFCVGAFNSEHPVYYGDGSRNFPIGRQVTLPETGMGVSISACDVNADGWLDLVLPIYLAAGPPISRTSLTPIWLGGPKGFKLKDRLLLPTDSGTGSLVSDFNFDGQPDIFIYCHRRQGATDRIGAFGDHVTDSFLYWGSADGFSAERRLGIPGSGPHYDSGVDLGDIRNREKEFDYFSAPFQYSELGRPHRLNWSAEMPPLTAIRFQVRTADSSDDLAGAEWQGPAGPDSFFETTGSSLQDLPRGEWIQYRAIFDTGNGAGSPILEMAEITFQ